MKQEPFIPECKSEPTSSSNVRSIQVKQEAFEQHSKLPNYEELHAPKRPRLEESDSENESLIESDTSEDDKYRCPICLSSYKEQNSAQPDVCEHRFCLECIEEWSKVSKIKENNQNL